MRKIIFYLSIIILVSACVSRYDVTLPQGEKRLVVNAFLSNDTVSLINNSVVQVIEVSQALNALENKWTIPDTTGSVVELFENGVKMQYPIQTAIENTHIRYLIWNFTPKAGKTYKLQIKMRGFDLVTAEQTMPADMPAFTVKYRDSIQIDANAGPFGGGQAIGGYDIAFTDNAQTEDYYELQAFNLDSVDTDMNGTYDKTMLLATSLIPHNNIGETVGNYDNSTVLLTDKTFNGQRFSFSALKPNYDRFGNFPPTAKRFLRINHITKDRYLYLKSRQKQLESGNSPFAEPAFVYSNVSTNLGVFLLANGRTQQSQ